MLFRTCSTQGGGERARGGASVRARRIGPAACFPAATLAALAIAGTALADEPRSATEPRVMSEPGEVVNVIDSFDDGDLFDLNVTLGFEYATKSAKILRETNVFAPGLTTGGFTSRFMNVAQYSETTTRLVPRVDVGVYKDIAVYFRLPIILANTRQLEDLDGSSGQLATVAQGAPGETLFSVPFKAPDRSGLEYLAVGAEVDILNQARDATKPTWLFGVEGRFAIGTPMHACNANPKPGQVECADPSDVNRDGKGEGEFEGTGIGAREPGVTRGTIGLALRTVLSRRVKYVEPYGGFGALFEFQQDSSDYGISDLQGSLVNHPPLVGTMMLGMMIHPWEHRAKYGRLTIDLRFTGDYRSEGRDYSELFDALGSSDAPSLRNPQYARFTANPNFNAAACDDNDPSTPCQAPSVVDEGSQKTYFTGLADVQAHGSYRGSVSVMWQASEYVKFTFGVGFRHDQAHGISHDQPCNPDFKNDARKSGPCRVGDGSAPTATGIPNPNYRPTINAVGRRFYVDASNTFDLFLNGVVMF